MRELCFVGLSVKTAVPLNDININTSSQSACKAPDCRSHTAENRRRTNPLLSIRRCSCCSVRDLRGLSRLYIAQRLPGMVIYPCCHDKNSHLIYVIIDISWSICAKVPQAPEHLHQTSPSNCTTVTYNKRWSECLGSRCYAAQQLLERMQCLVSLPSFTIARSSVIVRRRAIPQSNAG